MPLVQVSFIEGRSAEQKADLARRLTAAICEALDAPPESVRVLLNEMSPDDWYAGGRSIRERQAGSTPGRVSGSGSVTGSDRS